MRWSGPLRTYHDREETAMAIVEVSRPRADEPVPGPEADGYLDVRFCNIGQGDFTILSLPDGTVVVIDCGTKDWGNATADQLRGRLPKGADGATLPIAALILTHPDMDHYGQCASIIGSIPIGIVYLGGPEAQYRLFQFRKWWWQTAAIGEVKPVEVNDAHREPSSLVSGGGCTVWAIAANVPAPGKTSSYARNTASIVVRCVLGTDAVVIGADATCVTEVFMVANAGRFPAAALDAVVLRVAHHGSQTSSSRPFLQGVGPNVGVISAAAQNGYELPRESVVDRIKEFVASADEEHRISYYQSNGDECTGIVEDAVEQIGPIEEVVTPEVDEELWVTGMTGDYAFRLDGT
jgi:competence protein ComEC